MKTPLWLFSFLRLWKKFFFLFHEKILRGIVSFATYALQVPWSQILRQRAYAVCLCLSLSFSVLSRCCLFLVFMTWHCNRNSSNVLSPFVVWNNHKGLLSWMLLLIWCYTPVHTGRHLKLLYLIGLTVLNGKRVWATIRSYWENFFADEWKKKHFVGLYFQRFCME